jgi:anaerobic magnesium-protoporphyrin IX monomethyl ester cyclase
MITMNLQKEDKVLLINPASFEIYKNAKVKAAAPEYPPLNLATLAASIRNANIDVAIIDLQTVEDREKELKKTIKNFDPSIVGMTFTTPLFSSVLRICNLIKNYDKNIFLLGGGPHASAEPGPTLTESFLDAVVIGEGDFTVLDVIKNKNSLDMIKGICFKKNKKIICTQKREFIQNLDTLPFPAWDLIEKEKYNMPPIYCRKKPVGLMETSRGCPYGCVYCNKNIFGRTFRTKSPQRVIAEIKHILNSGFREIHFIDDTFSNDIERAKKICDEIKKEKLNFSWVLPNGIRIDRIDKELLEKMYSSGCYWLAFGVESGDQKILNIIGKNIKLDRVRTVFKMAKDIGFETEAFFMLALPGDTKKTMQKTIDFAKQLDPDIAKFDICTPLPGTPLYNDWMKEGRIKMIGWENFIFHKKGPKIFNHPNLDWETIDEYYDRAYREFYLRPRYILKRLAKGKILTNLKTFMKTKW